MLHGVSRIYGGIFCYTKDMILGIDEVGRGPWAGPLVVGAVVLGGAQIDGLTDSKKLSKKKRESLEIEILEKAQATGLGWVAAHELDSIGMSEALRLATRRAVEQIRAPYHEIIIDGTINFLSGTTKGNYVTTLPKADLLVPSVSAASIIAKVARDRYMAQQGELYPEYGFSGHAGYGVAKHRAAIEEYGVTPLHRLSFAPLKKYAAGTEDVYEEGDAGSAGLRTTRELGNDSEEAASKYLRGDGHEIIERNWKTKWCEIDIVSEKDGELYFTEVKHRKSATAGDGLAAITPTKLRQMKFAATFYAAKCPAKHLHLLAIATTGSEPTVTDALEII